jgi:hypothetical protein
VKTHLSSVAIGARIDQRDVEVEAHIINMFPRLLIIECIYYYVKLTEEFKTKSLLLNDDLKIKSYLYASDERLHLHVRVLARNLIP